MAWSLLNHMVADEVNKLLDGQKDTYEPAIPRFYSREQAAAIIHAALWGYGVRADSTAGCYAGSNMFDALGLKFWSFDQDESDACQLLRQKMIREKYTENPKVPE